MNIIRSYAEASVQGMSKILGVSLYPLSLGHILVMQAEGLKWISSEEETPSISALVDGLFICSQKHAEYMAWKNELNEWENPQNYLSYKLWKFLQKNESFIIWKPLSKYYYSKWENDKRDFYMKLEKQAKKTKNFNIMEPIQWFAKYIELGSRVPMFFVNEKKFSGDEVGNQWVENIYNCLISELSYTPEEALNMPLTQAVFDYLKIAEKNGSISFGSGYDEIMESIAMNKKLMEKT